MEIEIRDYDQDDASDIGRLIADTYLEFNLNFALPEDQALMLGPFRHARSSDPEHQQAIIKVLQSPIFIVAQVKDKIAGILRGRDERIASLFVQKVYHYQGVGRALVEEFEKIMMDEHISVVRVAATLYAVPFYSKLGYKKSTGVRLSWSFYGHGLPYQPMKKDLIRD